MTLPEKALRALARVISEVAAARGSTKKTVERRLVVTLDALAELLPGPPTEADLDRLLDLLLLAGKS